MDDKGKSFFHPAPPAIQEWAERYDTVAEAWSLCKRSSFMLWMLEQLQHSAPEIGRQVRAYACWCIRNTIRNDGSSYWESLPEQAKAVTIAVEEFLFKGAMWSEVVRASDRCIVEANNFLATYPARENPYQAACGANSNMITLPHSREIFTVMEKGADKLRELCGNPFA